MSRTPAEGTYNETAPTLASGTDSSLQVDINGNLKVTSATVAVDGDATPASGSIYLFGAEYRETPISYTDGDATIVQSDINGNLKTTDASRLDKTNDAVTAYLAGSDSRVAITSSAQVLSAPGKLRGFWIVSHTAGATVRFSDALTATTPYVSSAWTSALGHLAGDYIMLSQNGMVMATGCYCTIAGTIEILPDAMLS